VDCPHFLVRFSIIVVRLFFSLNPRPYTRIFKKRRTNNGFYRCAGVRTTGEAGRTNCAAVRTNHEVVRNNPEGIRGAAKQLLPKPK